MFRARLQYKTMYANIFAFKARRHASTDAYLSNIHIFAFKARRHASTHTYSSIYTFNLYVSVIHNIVLTAFKSKIYVSDQNT